MSGLFCVGCGHFIDAHRFDYEVKDFKCVIQIPDFDRPSWRQCDCPSAPSEIAKAALRRALPYPQIIGDSE